jgi:hypothetical protein
MGSVVTLVLTLAVAELPLSTAPRKFVTTAAQGRACSGRKCDARQRRCVGHFAAGIITAALAVELLPEIAGQASLRPGYAW